MASLRGPLWRPCSRVPVTAVCEVLAQVHAALKQGQRVLLWSLSFCVVPRRPRVGKKVLPRAGRGQSHGRWQNGSSSSRLSACRAGKGTGSGLGALGSSPGPEPAQYTLNVSSTRKGQVAG